MINHPYSIIYYFKIIIMKRIFLLAIFVCLLGQTAFLQGTKTLTATNHKVKLEFSVDEKGIPQYAVLLDATPVILASRLGFKLNGGIQLDSNFAIVSSHTKLVDETWKPVWGEVSTIRNQYTQLTVQLKQQSTNGLLLNIVFKVYEEGVGFRYEIPIQPNMQFFVVANEVTEFNLTGDHKTFWIPGDFDSNEYLYTTSRLSEINAWKFPIISGGTLQQNIPDQYAVQTPLMLKSAEGLYINIHEAALVNYPSMQLHVNRSTYGLSANLVPDALGNKAYLRTPARTPWRTIIVSDKATTLLASKMILNLNEPSVIKNTAWIKPMKFMGVW